MMVITPHASSKTCRTRTLSDSKHNLEKIGLLGRRYIANCRLWLWNRNKGVASKTWMRCCNQSENRNWSTVHSTRLTFIHLFVTWISQWMQRCTSNFVADRLSLIQSGWQMPSLQSFRVRVWSLVLFMAHVFDIAT